MSEFKFACPRCDQHIACDESYYGVQINCPACSAPITVPVPSPRPRHAHTGSPPPNLNVANELKISSQDPSPTTPRKSRPSQAPRKRMHRPSKPRGKSWLTTFLLAWFLGGLGIDRFYNGRVGLGIGKFLTGGACGLWSLIDILLLLFGRYQDGQGNALQPAKRGHMVAALLIIPATVLLYAGLIMSPILASLGQANARLDRINCMNNLRAVGDAFGQWAADHGDQFPFNVPAAKGGTREYCERTADGFDANGFRHFQVISNRLILIHDPKVLVCPADISKAPATDWDSLDSSNVSYLLRSGSPLSENTPGEVLARCPIHGTTLYCDGRVKQERNQ